MSTPGNCKHCGHHAFTHHDEDGCVVVACKCKALPARPRFNPYGREAGA
jgi:hypothetical protein